jgi:hypothetical protein
MTKNGLTLASAVSPNHNIRKDEKFRRVLEKKNGHEFLEGAKILSFVSGYRGPSLYATGIAVN